MKTILFGLVLLSTSVFAQADYKISCIQALKNPTAGQIHVCSWIKNEFALDCVKAQGSNINVSKMHICSWVDSLASQTCIEAIGPEASVHQMHACTF